MHFFDVNAPWSRWQAVRSFDGAEACENFRLRGVNTYEAKRDAEEAAAWALSVVGRCVPAEVFYRK